MNKDILREKILNPIITQESSNNVWIEDIERLRAEMNNLIELYKNELNNTIT